MQPPLLVGSILVDHASARVKGTDPPDHRAGFHECAPVKRVHATCEGALQSSLTPIIALKVGIGPSPRLTRASRHGAIVIHYRRLPARSELRAAVGVLIEEIEQAVRTLLPRPATSKRVRIPSSVGFIRRLGLLQLPGTRPGLDARVGASGRAGRARRVAPDPRRWIVPTSVDVISPRLV